MSIQGPDYHSLPKLDRVQPIGERDNSDRFGRGKKKSQYLGRAWSEGEEDELFLEVPNQNLNEEKMSSGIYADRALLEKAKKHLDNFATLEEKLAQLCFFSIEGDYDRENQVALEEMIRMGNVGGLIFTRGDFRRESYLIERFQDISKSPILMGNDFLHGLYFYFQGECPVDLLPNMSEARLCDLAKAIVFQNRKLGVQLQLVRESFALKSTGLFSLDKERSRAFGRGLREAHAIVGRERSKEKPLLSIREPHTSFTLVQSEPSFEVFSLRTLYYLDLTKVTKEKLESSLISAFSFPFDILLLPPELKNAPEQLARLLCEGKLHKSIVDRQLLKILLLKMGAFPGKYARI